MGVYIIRERDDQVKKDVDSANTRSKNQVSSGQTISEGDKKTILADIRAQFSDLDPMQKLVLMSKVKKVLNVTTSYVNSKPSVTEQELFYVVRRAAPELEGLFGTLDVIRPLVEGELQGKTPEEILGTIGISPADIQQHEESIVKFSDSDRVEETLDSFLNNVE